MTFCASIKITDVTTGKVTENYHSWRTTNSLVCGNLTWAQIGNETLKIALRLTNGAAISETVKLTVLWKETLSGIVISYTYTANHTIASGTVDYNITLANRIYQLGTTYTITGILINDIQQIPSEPTKVCNVITVESGAGVPTVTIWNATFAYDDPIDCTALDSNCEETITVVSGKHVSAKCEVECSANAKFKLKMVYVEPSGATFTITTTQQTQSTGTRGYCIISPYFWKVGTYTTLKITAIDVVAG